MATNQQALGDMKHQRGHGLRRGRTFVAPLRRVVARLRRPLATAAAQDHPGAVCRHRQANGPRDAAVFVDAGQALFVDRTRRGGRRAGGRPAGARPQQGRPHRHLVAEPLGVAADAICHRAHWPGAGQHQSGLPPHRARICAQQGRLPRADQRRPLQDLRLSRHDRDAGAGARHRRAGQAEGRQAAEAGIRHPHGRRQFAGHVQFRRCDGARRPRRARAPRPDLGIAEARRRRQHPVHLGHDRRAEGRDAHPRQHRQQRQFRHGGDALRSPTTGSAFRCRSITASAW